MRAYLLLALLCVLSVAALAQSSSAVPSTPTTNVPAPVATPDGPAAPTVPANPTPAPTTPTVTVTNPPTPVSTKSKRTPGRDCTVRLGCGDCLKLSYCVWSPSRSKCLDKHHATHRDDVVTTCDPHVCAKHGGKPVGFDHRRPEHHRALLGGVRGRRVIADAEAVQRLHPHEHKYDPLPHLKHHRRHASFPRTISDDPHVHIKKGKKHLIFESDNRGPIIRGEREERKRRYLAEKRLHRKLVIKHLLEKQHLLSRPKENKFRTPEYYPSKKEKLAHARREERRRHRRNESRRRDAELRHKLERLRRRANRALHAKRYLVSSKRDKIESILTRLSAEIDLINREAATIDNDESAFRRISHDVDALSRKVRAVCDHTFALLEEQSKEEEQH